MKVRTGDTVKVITGKDKGKEGVVTKVMRPEGKITVEGLNIYKRHTKGSQGGIIEFPAPMDASNVKVIKTKADTKKK